jgi:hypothetical protein
MKTSKTLMLAAIFSFAVAGAWIGGAQAGDNKGTPTATPTATPTPSSPAGGQIGPGTSSPQVGNNSSRDPKSNVKINAVKKN